MPTTRSELLAHLLEHCAGSQLDVKGQSFVCLYPPRIWRCMDGGVCNAAYIVDFILGVEECTL